MEEYQDKFFERLAKTIGDSIVLSNLVVLIVSVVAGAILGLFFVVLPIVVCEQLHLAANLIAYLYLDPFAAAVIVGASFGILLFIALGTMQIASALKFDEWDCLTVYHSIMIFFVSVGIFLVTWGYALISKT